MTTRTLTKKGLCKSNIFEARVTFEIIDIACINILTNSVEVVKIKRGTLLFKDVNQRQCRCITITFCIVLKRSGAVRPS